MSKILYFSRQDTGTYPPDIEKKNTLRDSILYFLNNQDTSGFIFDIMEKPDENRNILLLIEKFNPLVPVIIISKNEISNRDEYKKWNPNVLWAKNVNEAMATFHPYVNKRQFYRITWPLNVVFSSSFDMKGASHGKILTLSLGGAYVLSDAVGLLKKDSKIICRIEFSIFFLLVESHIVRVVEKPTADAPKGFAVQFENITEATKKCINKLINDEVISILSKELHIPI
jgi:hypothetical protein